MICKCIQSKPVSHLCPYRDMSGTNSTRKIRLCSTTGERRVSRPSVSGMGCDLILSRFFNFNLPLHILLLCASWRCSCPCTRWRVSQEAWARALSCLLSQKHLEWTLLYEQCHGLASDSKQNISLPHINN